MKKFLITFAVAALALCAGARTLTPDEALQRAATPKGTKAPALNSTANLQLVAEGEYQGIKTYYIFSGQNASLILGADDIAQPILGYLDYEVTPTMPVPPEFDYWMEFYGREMQHALKYQNRQFIPVGAQGATNFQPRQITSQKVYAGPQNTKTAERVAVAPLLTTTWDQGKPYNNLCPTGCYTGCVATAMAQVMKYHNYPANGTGLVKTTYGGKTLSMNLDGLTFAWSDMLNNYKTATSGTEAQRTAVAQLMQACGYSVEMNYGTSASGAMSQKLVGALVDHFNYDLATDYIVRDYMQPEEWEEMVYQEVKAGRPLLYGGRGTGGGHQFVCDGYRTDGYFHFNWGWSGAYDGYFLLTSLVPEGQGAGGNEDGFTTDQDGIFYVQKPVAGAKQPTGWVCISDGNLTGSISGTTITLGASWGFANMSGFAGNFDLGYTIAPKSGSGTAKTTTITSNVTLGIGNGYKTLATSFAGVANGDYTLTPVYRISGTTQWLPMKHDYWALGALDVNVNSGNLTITSTPGIEPTPPPVAGAKLTFTSPTGSGFAAGSTFTLKVTCANTGSEDYTGKLAAVLIDDENYILSDYPFQDVTIAAGESKQLTFNSTIDDDVVTGTYGVGIINSDLNLLVAYSVDVSGVTKSDVTVTTFTAPDVFPYATAQTVSASVKNNSTTAASVTLDLHLLEERSDGYYVAYSFGSKTSTIFGGKTKTYSYSCTVPSSVTAGRYALAICEGNSVLESKFVTVGSDTGVENIITDGQEGQGTYFDLQGRPINEPQKGLYLHRTNSGTTKVIVK